MARLYRFILTIFKSATREDPAPRVAGSFRTNFSLNKTANSPMVMPCRAGIEHRARKLLDPSSTTTGPSVMSPPSGFGRSKTTTRTFFGSRRGRSKREEEEPEASFPLRTIATATNKSYRLDTHA
jgi:hypothetical protein